jgi:hypothetical protein
MTNSPLRRSLCRVVLLATLVATCGVAHAQTQSITVDDPHPVIHLSGDEGDTVYSCRQDSDCMAVTSNCTPCLDLTAINTGQLSRYEQAATRICGMKPEPLICFAAPVPGKAAPHPVCTSGTCRLIVPIPDQYRTCMKDSDCVFVSTACIRCGNEQGINVKWLNDYLIMLVHATDMCGRATGGSACPQPIPSPRAACISSQCQ